MALSRLRVAENLDGYRDRGYDDLTPDERVAYQIQSAQETIAQGVEIHAVERMWMSAAAQRFLDGAADAEDVRALSKKIIHRAETTIRAWALLALEEGLDDPAVLKQYPAARGWSQLLSLLGEIIAEGNDEERRLREGDDE